MGRDYILRISTDEYQRRIFSDKCYYAGVRRKWERGSIIFLARKAEGGDSIIGQGAIRRVLGLDELTEEEKEECRRENWRCKLVFDKSLVKYKQPLALKEVLGGDLPKGRVLHGHLLTPIQTDRLLAATGMG